MLSRVAEHIYWMARYIERAEDTARIVNVTASLLLDLPRETVSGWEPAISITGSDELFGTLYGEPDEASVVRFLVEDSRNPSSIVSSLRYARENLRTTRDVVPREAWEQLNDLCLEAARGAAGGLSRHRRYDFLKRIILGAQQITGLLAGTMSHNAAYQFVRMGRNLERGEMTTRILDVRSATLLVPQAEDLTPFENIQWMSVLKSLSAYQMYRQQVRLRVQGPDVLRFLLQDPLFPRATYHCLQTLGQCLDRLPRAGEPMEAIRSLESTLMGADVRALAREGLHEFIDEVQRGLGVIHHSLATTYFPHLPGQTQGQIQA